MSKRKRDEPKRRCAGRSASGRPCGGTPLPGSTRCWHHSYKVPGRPSKLTPELTERLVEAVRAGAYFEVAAQVGGIDKTTLYRWLRRGEEALAKAFEHVENIDDLEDGELYNLLDPAEWPYVDFRHSLKSAEAIAEIELLEAVRMGGFGAPWQAAMTILERRWPHRWGRRDRVTVDDERELGKPRRITPEESKRDTILGILVKAGVGGLAAAPPEDEAA